MPEPPLKVDFEKTYIIDEVGNVEVKRSWILLNQATKDIDISYLRFYVNEVSGIITNVKAEDSSGPLSSFKVSKVACKTKLSLDPRPTTLSSQQSYRMTLSYQFPSFVHKLGEAWLFTELIEGMNASEFSGLVSNRTDSTLQVALPNFRKRFWQTVFHESEPCGLELPTAKKTGDIGNHTVLQWTTSLTPDSSYNLELIFGVKTNTRLVQFLTAVGTAIAVGLVDFIFKRIGG